MHNFELNSPHRMHLSEDLRKLVHHAVATLGHVIKKELGNDRFSQIETLRLAMTETREQDHKEAFAELKLQFVALKKLRPKARLDVARSFTLMLELMNACENAYRSHRLNVKAAAVVPTRGGPDAIVYVLTAHPTEARSPQNIAIFHQIQRLLTVSLSEGIERTEKELQHLLEVAWRTPIVRSKSPAVKDEAEHIYSLLFRDEVLQSLLDRGPNQPPFFVRSWVGGDKDGHPGVDRITLLQSLNLSRHGLLLELQKNFLTIRKTLKLVSATRLDTSLLQLDRALGNLKTVKAGDARLVLKFKNHFSKFITLYAKEIGSVHPDLGKIQLLLRTFPGLVVPLELRESSEILTADPKQMPKLAIYKMLQTIASVAKDGNPRWYARGFIVSMTQSIEHILAAARFQKAIFGALRIPIIPLFEEAASLAIADLIVAKMVKDRTLNEASRRHWDSKLEIMVGYSDSAKEAGVLGSRLAIAKALPALEKICEDAGLTPIFFHGSGGSIDRGGGTIEDQTAWWPKAALRTYKVTIQGEMVERSMATPEIARRQLEKITEHAARGLVRTTTIGDFPVVDEFAGKITNAYREAITSLEFLNIVESATPYSYLNALKIGSRPSKRTVRLTVKGLRAIPWVLCWTQTRVLFQTWWGVGQAWSTSSPAGKKALQAAFKDDPVFTSYIKALGFTLAKVELGVWKMYLDANGLADDFFDFNAEFENTKNAYLQICGQSELMWYKPWLGESITLRAPMIHPLNLLQILALQDRDLDLLRLTVTGISSGMMSTG